MPPVSWAAVDVNKATDAELDALRGVGPALSKRIIEARKQGAFKDWPDLMSGSRELKAKAAAKLPAEGLTVNGQSYSAVSPAANVANAEPKKKENADAKP